MTSLSGLLQAYHNTNPHGVEEEKEECLEGVQAGVFSQQQTASPETGTGNHGFRAQLESLAQTLYGGCGYVMQVMISSCQVSICLHPQPPPQAPPPPLSIADEMRLLAAMAPAPPVVPPRGDIPKFLGEDAVYSFEDDNISAISAHTLEEMEHSNKEQPQSGTIGKGRWNENKQRFSKLVNSSKEQKRPTITQESRQESLQDHDDDGPRPL